MERNKLVLVSMQKNESENCITMLKSVEGLYEKFIIGFDKTSSDGTPDLVKNYMRDHNHIGIFYEFDWVNDFSKSRNLYLDLALKEYPDFPWLLIMDGDDILNPGRPPHVPDSREQVKAILNMPLENFPYEAINAYIYLDIDQYGIPLLFYPRVHMVRNLPNVRFMFASHNTIDVPGEKQILVKEFIVIHKQKPKKRAERELQRIEMNIPNLEQQMLSNSNPDASRGYFYLGNTYMDSGNPAKAKECYIEYLKISTWPDERYQARIHLAGIYFMEENIQEAYAEAEAALHETNQWARSEAYILLSDCCLASGQIPQALHWLEIASRIKPPVNGLFLQGHLYTWLPPWRLMLLYDKLQNWDEAYRHAKIAAEWRQMPEMTKVLEILSKLSVQNLPPLDFGDRSQIYQIREEDIQFALS